jgi:multidrug resistance efflux pump
MKKVLFLTALLSLNVLFADVYATYEVKPVKEASLNLSSSGIVSVINTDIGNQVKKGDVLLSLNDIEEKANLEISKSEYQFLLTQYERYSKSAEVFDKNTLDKLKSELKNAKDIVTLNEAKVSKMRIIAPFSGVVSEKNIEIGDKSDNGDKALLKLVSNDKKLLLSFDSKYTENVKIGDKFCLNSNNEDNKKCVEIFKVYPTLNDNKKLNAEAYGIDLKIGSFGDGSITNK